MSDRKIRTFSVTFPSSPKIESPEVYVRISPPRDSDIQIPVLKVLGLNPTGITKKKGELNMKARFQIFKAPFLFVGWLAPAYRDMQSRWNHKT